MCGICGYLHLNRGAIPPQEVLERMCLALRHRGPDDQGVFFDEYVALGQRRLSIIDLAGGHQPLFNEDGDIAIVFNGEIYNFSDIKARLDRTGRHVFKTNSDTEVIIHLYEEEDIDCLKSFNGMFAFAIWDKKQERLFCARDRMGKKPLYYTMMNNHIVFASELKALILHPEVRKSLSLKSLSKYLAFEYIPAPATIFEGIFKLDPGHYFVVDMKQPWAIRREIVPRQYWDIEFKPAQRPVHEITEEFLRRFKEAVRLRLISDVPLGVFLSGGIDSSSVVAMMAELMPSKDIKTFSIGFSEKSFDESTYARRIANYFHTDHREDVLTPEMLLDILPEVCDNMDEPFGDPSIIPTFLLSRFTRKYVTVALGGDGGDELFAGYDPFLAHYPAKYLEKLPMPVIKVLASVARLLPVSTRNISFDFKIKQFLSAMQYRYGQRHFAWLGSFPPSHQRMLLTPDAFVAANSHNPFSVIDNYLSHIPIQHELDGIIYLYCKLYLQDDILVKVDRTSMANSLEVRAPFLDVNVVEFVNTIPHDLKLRGFTTKYILRQAMQSKLPRDIVNRRKKGFGIPIADWFKNELKPVLLDLFQESKLKQQGLFQPEFVRNLMHAHFTGRADNRKQLWTLFMFEKWYEKYCS
jgi:asparagine synthase (glutamine-hydrolysing)